MPLLLFGGAIQVAGAVKSNKIKKGATSDFMEIERQRGISVATSVMGFEYNDVKINILDTPGHQDFAEDTYRTLSAVDSVIVVIDVAKGVETQTEKLVAVCRMRDIPIIVFINKMDRNGKDVFDLLDEVEQKLGLKVSPLSWPKTATRKMCVTWKCALPRHCTPMPGCSWNSDHCHSGSHFSSGWTHPTQCPPK